MFVERNLIRLAALDNGCKCNVVSQGTDDKVAGSRIKWDMKQQRHG